MSPFERFFADAFQRELEEVVIPADAWATPPAEEPDASWDRRAAWLLWCEREGIPVIFRPRKKPVALTDDGY